MPNDDAGPGTPNPISYNVGAETVLDNVTNLTWQKDQPAAQTNRTYADAKAACDNLMLASDSSWRLPSRIELVTLLDLEKQPRIAPAFSNTTPTAYWSSSEVRRPAGVTGSLQYWVVDFGDGNVEKLSPASTASVRCVKGAP
jgi:hypothetical protein